MTDNIDVGQLSEAINDKMDRDANNAEDALRADYVIDYQAPTAENNYTWYRLYRSGWVEQGGRKTKPNSSSISITLPMTMRNTDYDVMITDAHSTNMQTAPCYNIVDVSNFTIYQGNSASVVCHWEAKGMSAQS